MGGGGSGMNLQPSGRAWRGATSTSQGRCGSHQHNVFVTFVAFVGLSTATDQDFWEKVGGLKRVKR